MAFTFFFRDQRVLDSIVHGLIPIIPAHNIIRVWDAGCASGEEAYSIAMLLHEVLLPSAADNLRIDATDIEENSQFANTIATGTYASELLKGSPHQDLLAKYSHPADQAGYVEFDSEIRDCIFYRRHDLLSLRPVGDNYDVVVCKNVLLHLTNQQCAEVIKMFHRSLSAAGYLALDELQEVPAQVSHLFVRDLADGKLYQKATQA